jgi:phytoene dehydrogenase-like protein
MKKIIIIGAGFAGLSSGIYARKNGYDAIIFESHFLPGGLCTSWKRKGFTFEGCFHYIKLLGTAKKNMFHSLWKELGIFSSTKIINTDILQTFQDDTGRTLHFYTDPKKLESQMLAHSLKDKKEIKAFCATVKRCYWFTRSAGKNPLILAAKLFNILCAIPFLNKYGNMNLGEYSRCYKDTLIQTAISRFFEHPEVSCIQLPIFLGMYSKEGVNFPEGGSLNLARSVERTFLDLGGKIEYRKKVKRIIINDGRATGIELDNGTLHEADFIISAADGHSTLFEMLDNQYTPPKLLGRYKNLPVYDPFIQVSLGINRFLSDLPCAVRIQTTAPFEIAGEIRNDLLIANFSFDKTMAPSAKSSIVVLYTSNLSWWEKVEYNTEAYQSEKMNILQITVEQLAKILPGISKQIEVSDISTPHTVVRYTNNWKGALGFMVTASFIKELRKPISELPGLSGFYMAGQWTVGMGVPNVALSGKQIIEKICKTDGKKFNTN